MSAFLSSAHCQLKWFSQRKLQGKVAASVPLQRVGAGKAQWVLRQARCARVWSVRVLAFPTHFAFFFFFLLIAFSFVGNSWALY